MRLAIWMMIGGLAGISWGGSVVSHAQTRPISREEYLRSTTQWKEGAALPSSRPGTQNIADIASLPSIDRHRPRVATGYTPQQGAYVPSASPTYTARLTTPQTGQTGGQAERTNPQSVLDQRRDTSRTEDRYPYPGEARSTGSSSRWTAPNGQVVTVASTLNHSNRSSAPGAYQVPAQYRIPTNPAPAYRPTGVAAPRYRLAAAGCRVNDPGYRLTSQYPSLVRVNPKTTLGLPPVGGNRVTQLRVAQNCQCTPTPPPVYRPPAGYQAPALNGGVPNLNIQMPGQTAPQPVCQPNLQLPSNLGVPQYGAQGARWWTPFVSGSGVYTPLFRRSMPPGTYLGQGIIGQPTAYVDGQPIRNLLRYLSP